MKFGEMEHLTIMVSMGEKIKNNFHHIYKKYIYLYSSYFLLLCLNNVSKFHFILNICHHHATNTLVVKVTSFYVKEVAI